MNVGTHLKLPYKVTISNSVPNFKLVEFLEYLLEKYPLQNCKLIEFKLWKKDYFNPSSTGTASPGHMRSIGRKESRRYEVSIAIGKLFPMDVVTILQTIAHEFKHVIQDDSGEDLVQYLNNGLEKQADEFMIQEYTLFIS